jgi:hypothetical protein
MILDNMKKRKTIDSFLSQLVQLLIVSNPLEVEVAKVMLKGMLVLLMWKGMIM